MSVYTTPNSPFGGAAGPFDEIVLMLVAPVFFLLYRTPTREAWEQARS